MKRAIYVLILSLLVVSGLVVANHERNNETSEKATPKPHTAAEMAAERKKWEATPDGIAVNEWKKSPEGQKVLASAAKIKKHISDSTAMEAVVTSLSLPPGSRLGFGVMVSIDGDEYILSFGPKKADEFQQLRSLQVNDKITLRSRFVSHAPKYAYPIVSGDYVERDGQLIYKAIPGKGC